jgi:5'-deoxynucleotidase YfbR-like HD superfamily hydrolase
MSKILTISDDLYGRLETAARQRGLSKIEDLLEAWQESEAERSQRAQAVERIDALRTRLFAAYGEMPDSVELIREDRAR